MIFIRTDANEKIGTGHVMRCLSIAYQIRKLNHEVSFITADERSKTMIEEEGYPVICLNSQWDDLDQEIGNLCRLLTASSVDKLLVDSYFITEKYLSAIRQRAAVFYIDDLNCMSYPVDILINYNLYGPDQNYQSEYNNMRTRFLLGTSYVPLRKEFTGIQKRKFRGNNRILITSGGTDNYNMVERILSKMLSVKACQNKEYYCILGRFHKNSDYLYKTFGGSPNIHLLHNVSNMDFYMKKCDTAVTAGGTTIYELCACGIPSILYTIADNQLGIAHAFSEKGIIPWVGDVRENLDTCLNKTIQEIQWLNDGNCWERQSRKMQEITDGNGAFRIAQEIIKYNARQILS